MIPTEMFDRAHLGILKNALTAYANRQRVTAENIANVETEGYRAREYRFEDLLRRAGGRTLAGARTNPHHLPIGPRNPEAVTGQEVTARTGYDNGVNNVDIDAEMTRLATTSLSYRLATRLLSMRYAQLREAVTGRVR